MNPGHNHVEIRSGAYADSVTLLQVSRDVAATPGVEAAQIAMATPLNLDVLEQMGFTIPPADPNDMVIALRVTAADQVASAVATVDAALAALQTRSTGGSTEVAPPRTTGSALRSGGDIGAGSLAVISVPGAHAFVEAMDALDADRDVMIFSDNMPLDQERRLKQTASQRGLLVMGPDCGTAVVGGVGLGFANVTQPGPVGIVAASGTGCQQLLCLLDAAGVGVSAAIGVGGRDLSADIGGISTITALDRLDADPAVAQIVLVSKPPAAAVADVVRRHAAELSTPVEFALLGSGQPDLTQAAEQVVERIGRPVPRWQQWGESGTAPSGRWVRGLFVGGTLCDEAMLIAGESLGGVRSNIPLDPSLGLGTDLLPSAHSMIDFGDDELTQGRAHPMIDPTLRLDQITRAAADPETAVLLLDLVLGHGAEPDPAALLAPAIAEATARGKPVIVACVGTASDPQDLHRQATALATAGAEVHLSNARATRRAIAIATESAKS